MIQVKLPWPPRELHPNARVHWGAKARKAKQYRTDCAWAMREVLGRKRPAVAGEIRVDLEFIPATAHKRDADGLLASLKNGIDGVADALGVDDSRFVYGPMRIAQARKGKPGVVVMSVSW